MFSDGSYGAPKDVFCSFPVVAGGWRYDIVDSLDICDFSRTRIDRSAAELVEEREAVVALGLVG